MQSTSTATLRWSRSTESTKRPLCGFALTRMPSTSVSGPRVISDLLALAQIGMGQDGHAGAHDPPKHFDLAFGNDGQPVPSFPKDADEPSHLPHLDVALLVEGVAEEEISGKHRDARETPEPASRGPRLDLRQKRPEPLGGQLVGDELLAVAARPQRVPAGRSRGRVFRLLRPRLLQVLSDHRAVRWQGFAPFGSEPLSEAEPARHLPRLPDGRGSRGGGVTSRPLIPP